MKYLKGYQKFLNESKIAIDKNALVVEKKVLEDFSSDFWNLCMRSAVFTTEEKTYIKESLAIEKVSLIKEEWEWLDNAIDWAKDKGEKMLNYVSDKIKKLREGIKNFVSSMIKYAKSLLMAGLTHALEYAKEAKKKFTGDGKVKKQIEDLDPVQSKNEFTDLKKTLNHWSPNITEGVAKVVMSQQMLAKMESEMQTSESETVSSSTKNLEEAETESKNESISNILSSTNDDVLMSFYNLVKESDDVPEGEEKEENKGVVGWILSFLGQEKIDPDAKAGKKILWWGKLFLKILSACLSPILKVVEATIKGGANLYLKAVSLLTAKYGGPGPFKFALLGGLSAGLVGLIYDSLMLFHVEATGTDTFAIVKAWLAHSINHALELFPDYKTLKTIFAAFCTIMTIWHVAEEIKHLAHGGHGHGEHKEGEHKEGEKVEAPTQGEKPGQKPAAPTPTKPGTPGATPAPATV